MILSVQPIGLRSIQPMAQRPFRGQPSPIHFSGHWSVEADIAEELLEPDSSAERSDFWDKTQYFKANPPYHSPEQGKKEAEDAFRKWDDVIAQMPQEAEFRYSYNEGVLSFVIPKSPEFVGPALHYVVTRDITQVVKPIQMVVDAFVNDIITLMESREEESQGPTGRLLAKWIVQHLLRQRS